MVSDESVDMAWVISIHAPAEGATARYLENSLFISDFNPRSRGGSDLRSGMRL